MAVDNSAGSRVRRPRWRYIVGVVVLLAASPARACNVPVFRYALEHWEADPYRMVIFHRGPLSAPQQRWIQAFQDCAAGNGELANLAVQTVDVAGELTGPLQALWKSQGAPTLPWVVLQYPEAEDGATVWAGPLTAETAGQVIDSPVRRLSRGHILQGESVVWLVLKSGDAARDGPWAGEVEKESRRLASLLELPTLDDQDKEYLAPIPLRLSFAVVPLDRNDPTEAVFVRSLLRRLPAEVAEAGPLIFPVFGRGRVLPPIPPDGKLALNMERAARFLLAACSCQVKRLNPGDDLLWRCDWEKRLAPSKPPEPLAKVGPITPTLAAVSAVSLPEDADSTFPASRRWWLVGALVPAGLMVVVTARWAFGTGPGAASGESVGDQPQTGGQGDAPKA